MSPEDAQKQKSRQQQKNGLKRTLQGVLEKLRDGLEELADGLIPAQPQRVPIPIPVRQPRRR